ncbi:SDR family NAD(P)-dependent oxidoreductase [Thermostaphylospora chromogena]|uniref:Gluconate 5-dehydrogenase n=1 Tax=Thermostaphylospora chromogena TaxID=35622 RepID=A0A1H1H3T5_9ACTN|nr:SDR family oxidoreductase [Thermostaphylospora chromogena]SDR20165.1 gluconate 5-dehydrogenase [Thermostaphylospora chromogena]
MAGYLDELFSLAGRTALVTGGSSGIGWAIAHALGRAGADVVIAARDPRALDRALSSLRDHGVNAAAVPADLADPDHLTRLCEQARRHFGDIDILVNNAATNIRRPMADLTPDDYRRTIAVNLTAPYLLGQHFGPRMAERGWGRIINIASQQALRAFGHSGAYGVSKAGLTGLTRSQSEAWAPRGVRANAIVPGFVLTPLTRDVQAVPGRVEQLAARTHIGRNGLPADYAGIAVFLASPASDYLTGQVICVDGGFSVA